MVTELKYKSRNQHLFQQTAGEDLLALLLTQRGVEEVQTFLQLPHTVLHDSFQLKHIDSGIQLLTQHLAKQSKICILVD